LLNVLAPTLDASQSVGGIIKLCRKSGVDISRFGMFPFEKANDYSLLELHEKWRNSKCTYMQISSDVEITIDIDAESCTSAISGSIVLASTSCLVKFCGATSEPTLLKQFNRPFEDPKRLFS
jgi:hypothetical protein